MSSNPFPLLLETNQEERRQIFQLLSLFLQYPDKVWTTDQYVVDSIEAIHHPIIKQNLREFWSYVEQTDFDDLTVNYVYTFDFNSKAALYLTYSNQEGERERGELLLQLKQQYEMAGFHMYEKDLPDYIPLFLEFIAVAPINIAVQMITKYQDVIKKIYEALLLVNSPYASVLHACVIAIYDH